MWDALISEEIKEKKNELVKKAESLRNSGVIVCPEQKDIFKALSLTPPGKVKVCIIGQDPYHTPGAANGLAFSINKGRKLQPSLRNIFKELHNDVGVEIPDNGDLTPWAMQGVLLLNSCLTVTAGVPNSHKDWGWQEYTGEIFNICLNKLPQPIVFILWGAYAQRFADGVQWQKYTNKTAIMSAHPSPMSASRGFFGSKPFSRVNSFLMDNGVAPVDWRL